jgi:hypothetical protein
MQRPRDLIVTNVAVLLVLLAVLLVGWREAAAFGLAVLVILDLMVVIREHSGRPKEDKKE